MNPRAVKIAVRPPRLVIRLDSRLRWQKGPSGQRRSCSNRWAGHFEGWRREWERTPAPYLAFDLFKILGSLGLNRAHKRVRLSTLSHGTPVAPINSPGALPLRTGRREHVEKPEPLRFRMPPSIGSRNAGRSVSHREERNEEAFASVLIHKSFAAKLLGTLLEMTRHPLRPVLFQEACIGIVATLFLNSLHHVS